MSVGQPRRPQWQTTLAGQTVGRGAGIAHLLSLALTFAVLTYYGARQWFFADEWEFITRNMPGPNRLGLFIPHNEHWSTIPLLIYRGLFSVFALHTYLPYVLVAIGLHIVAAHLVWRIALRAGADPWLATGVAATFLVLGVGYEQMINAFQASFELSLVCGLAWLLVSDRVVRATPRVLLGWTLGVAASMSSGIALPMIAVVALATWGGRGVRAAVVAVSVPVAVNVAWYLAVHPRETLPATGHSLLLLPLFVARGITATANGAVGLWWLGTALFLGLLVWVARRWRTVPAIAWSGVVGAFVLFTVVGYGRVSLGISQATSSRYVYLAAALLAPAVALALTAAIQRQRGWQAAILVVIAACTAHGAVVLHTNIGAQTALRDQVRDTVMAAAAVVISGEPLVGNQPDPIYDPDIDVPDLRTLVDSGALPVTAPRNPLSLVTVQSRLQVAVSDAEILGGGTAPQLSGRSLIPTGSCTEIPPGPTSDLPVQLFFPAPAAVALTAVNGTSATIVLRDLDLPLSPTAPPLVVALSANHRLYLNVSAPHAYITLTAPGGVVICGASP